MTLLQFSSYICFLTCALGIIFSIYILLRFKEYKTTYYLLALIFSLCWIEFYMFALSSKNILQMTFLFRSAFPFRTLAPMLLWLYVWKILNPTKPFQLIQWVHFIIPIIVIIGLLPDFIKPVAYKIEMLATFYKQNNYLMSRKTGIFPAGFIQPFLLIYGLIYIFISIRYIFKIKQKRGVRFSENNKILLNWILLVAIVNLIFVLLQSIQYLSLLVKGDFSFFAQIGQSLALISMKVYLLVHPNAIENLQGCLDTVDEMTEANVNFAEVLPKLQPGADIKPCSIVHQFLNEKQGYKDPNLSLDSMADQLSISKSKLSGFIQACYGLSYPEVINRFRINHFIELYKKDHLKQLKVETLILQSGYRNKTTFYLAFKKVLQTNPLSFIKDQQ